MVNNVEVGRDLGYLKIKDSTIMPADEIDRQAPSKPFSFVRDHRANPSRLSRSLRVAVTSSSMLPGATR